MKDADKGHSIVKLTGVAPEAPAQAVRGDFDRSDLEMIRVYEDHFRLKFSNFSIIGLQIQ